MPDVLSQYLEYTNDYFIFLWEEDNIQEFKISWINIHTKFFEKEETSWESPDIFKYLLEQRNYYLQRLLDSWNFSKNPLPWQKVNTTLQKMITHHDDFFCRIIKDRMDDYQQTIQALFHRMNGFRHYKEAAWLK